MLGALPLLDGAGERLHVRAQVRTAHVAERPQVGDLGLEVLPFGRGELVVRAPGGVGGPGPAGVRLLQDHAGPHLRLAQDLVAAQAGVLGEFPAVFLGVGHVTVGRLLCLGQHVHGLDVAVLRLDPGLPLALEQPLAQPQDLFLQHAVVVEQPPDSIGNPAAEGLDFRLIKTTAPQPALGESRRPHALWRQWLTIRLGHDSLQPKSST